MIIIFRLFLIFLSINAYSLEIIRDPIFENYFKNIQLKYDLPEANVYIVEHNEINAFVLGKNTGTPIPEELQNLATWFKKVSSRPTARA